MKPADILTKDQLHILQHSLGVDQYGRGQMFRNHYVGEDKTCRELVAMGLMTVHPASELTGGDPWFRVTHDGMVAMRQESPDPPKLSRSQKRYREFLNADCGYSFGEWLKSNPRRAAL